MHGERDERREGRRKRLRAIACHLGVRPDHRLGRRGAKRDDRPRLDIRDLGIEPHATRLDFAVARLLVNPPLAARLPLEVLHHVGEIHIAEIDAGILERVTQQLAGWTDERFAFEIFSIARLLADEHDAGAARAVPEHRLRGVLPEIAAPAHLCLTANRAH
jgi:hypothetical protein